MVTAVYFNRTYFDIHYLYFQATGDLIELHDENCDNQKLKIYKIISKSVSIIYYHSKTDNKILTNYAYSTRIESVILLYSTYFKRRAYHCSLHMKEQIKFMQIQCQSSLMKISHGRGLQEALLLTTDNRSRNEYIAKMINRSWDKDENSFFINIEVDLRYRISYPYDDQKDYDLHRQELRDILKMSMRNDWFLSNRFLSLHRS